MIDKDIPLFDHYANFFLKFKEPELKISTFEKYKSIIELRLLPFFKETPVTEIKTSDIKLWFLDVDDVWGKSKRIYISVMKGILEQGIIVTQQDKISVANSSLKCNSLEI